MPNIQHAPFFIYTYSIFSKALFIDSFNTFVRKSVYLHTKLVRKSVKYEKRDI